MTNCFTVVSSYDPNDKLVYPEGIVDSSNYWFTYTIHFQNTGSAPAFNIRLADTLDQNLDLSTFQVLNYSHLNSTSLVGNAINFRFPNILLADSTTNLEASKGFIQYRIKPKPNLPLGTSIKNTAHIYFDYNPAIVTNTTENLYVTPASISENSIKSAKVIFYPNPDPSFIKKAKQTPKNTPTTHYMCYLNRNR